MEPAAVTLVAPPAPAGAGYGAAASVLLCTLFWGFGFVATKWAIVGLGPLWMTVVRFGLAATLALPVVLGSARLRPTLVAAQWRLAFVPGLLLAAILLCQTVGLRFTTVTSSGFITTLYVVIVPLLSALFFGGRIVRAHWGLVAMALVGTALICGWEHLSFNRGDALTLLCAIAASLHMLVIERCSPRNASAFGFNVLQSAWAGICCLGAAAVLEPWHGLAGEPRELFGLFFLVVPCTLVAFALQVRAQRALPAVLVSLLFLLESPIAAVFGWRLFGERMELTQWIGALLILSAAGLASALQAGPR